MSRLAFPALLLLSGALSADVLFLHSGGTIEGIVVDEGASYQVTTTAGVTHVPKDKVAGLEKKDCVLTTYAREAARVAADDVAGHWRLAQMCADGKWSAKAREEARKVIAMESDHAEARKYLGYVTLNGVWMTPRERHETLGHVQYKGKWYPAEVARRLQAREERRAWLRRAEDQLNLALAHLADANRATRLRGQKEFIEAGEKYGVENPEATASSLLNHYDDAWKRYVAFDSTIGTIEVRATNAELERLDTITIDVVSPSVAGATLNRLQVQIETPHLKVHEVRATVQVPLALKIHLADPGLGLGEADDFGAVLGDD